MAPSAKGKEKVIYSKESAKRKRVIPEDNDGSGKRRNRAVLQFIEDAAYQVDDDESSDDDSMFDEDFEEEEFDDQVQAPFEPVKPDPRTPKQEQMSEEDYDRMMEKRYKPGSGFVAYEEDKYEPKYSVDESSYPPPATGAIIWKVKCTVGRERHSAFCLMQKYLDLKYLGTKLNVLSAFVLDHVKGFIYIEAEKQSYIYEACNGICSIYSTRAMLVPKDDISLLFSARSKGSGISEGMWARVKNGKYRGDLAQVMAVNDERKKVTVKLIPRIDLRALADKFGRGDRVDRNVTPVPRLISTSELEEFRPLIQIRRDRDTNKVFEVLDGMMFKDGYLYKKMSADSLSLWGVTPTEDELLKFEPAKVDEHNDDEWLTQLYGEKKKKRRPIISGKGGGKGGGGGKGEGSSTNLESNFEVHDLVFFWRKDFGVIIATEKEATFKIIKDNSDGPITLTVTQNELRSADFDKKLFTALDQHGNKISINDTVKVVDGPLKEREGVVKRIYKGIVFVYNETSEENNGYICFKAQMCEKLESGVGLFSEKGGGPVVSSFGDQSSPKSPLSPQITQQEDRGHKFDDDAMYSIGQSLRIRVGPLKGYLCRVLAIRRSDVTVKLDSKHKIITVKSEHLSEVRGRSAGMSLGVDSDPAKPFEPKEQDGSGDWAAGTTTTAEGGNWNTGGLSTERSSWAPGNSSAQGESSKPPEDGTNKDDSWAAAKPVLAGGSSWGAAASTPAGGTSWGAAAATPAGGSSWGTTPAAAATPAGGSSWGAAPAAAATPAGGSSWGAAPVAAATPAGGSSWGAAPAAAATPAGGSSWGAAPAAAATPAGGSSVPASGSSWGAAPAAEGTTSQSEQVSGWGTPKSSTHPEANNWNKAKTAEQGNNSWGSVKKTDESTKPWGKADKESTDGGSALSDKFEGTSNKADTSSWGDKSANKKTEGGGGNIWNSKKSSEGGSSSVWGQNKGTETSNLNSQNDSSCKTDGGDWNSKKSAGGEGDAGAWGISKSSAGGSSSGWGTDKKSEAGNQDSWGQKSSFKPDNNFGGNEGGSNGGWSSKKTVDGGSSVGWGKNKSDGPNDAGANQGSWGSKSIVEGGSSSGWGKGATEGGGNGGSSTGWGQSKRGGAADGGGETWSKKSTWNSDSDNNLGGNEDDTGRGGGNWRGGRGGRWGSDRGGRFGGGRSDSDRGGFGGGRGRSDRGGFGGRGDSDRGGFRGRGGDRGGGFRGGRDGSDRGGFRGRGGFGDRGRGRREGGWSNQNDSGEDNKPYSRSSTADKGASWSSGNGGGGSWSEKQSDNKGKWQSGGDGGNSQAGGWNRGSGSSQDGGADAKPSSWKNASEGGNVSGWASNNTSGGSWNSGDKGKNAAQGSGSDWNQSKGTSNVGGGAAGSGSGSGTASWGKPPSSSWSKPGGESGKGGW